MSSISGPLPLPVRHHRGGGGAGQPARVVHADADDERAHAPRARGTAAHGHEDAGSRARASTRGSTAATRGMLALVDAPPLGGRRARRRRWSSPRRVPLYGWVKQEYIPSDVDEGEFEATSTRPEGIGLAAMDEAMRADRRTRCAACPACAPCSSPRAAASSARSTRATSTSASRRTRSARSALARLWRGILRRATRWRPSAATTRQRDVMQQVRAADAQVPRPPRPRAQRPRLQHRRRQLRHRLRHPRARARGARRVRRGAAHARHRDRRHRRRRHHARARQARAAREASTATAPPTWRRHRADRHRAAAHGRRRRRSRASATRRSTRTTTSSSGSSEKRPQRPRRRSRASTSRAGARRGRAASCGSTTSSSIAPGFTASRIDRLDRQREVRLRAGVAPGYAPGRPHRGPARRRRRDEPAARLHDRGLRPRPRAGAHVHRVPLGVPALDRSSCT